MKFLRRIVYWFVTSILVASFLSSCTLIPQTQAWPTEGWPVTTPEEQGVDSTRLAEALLAMREQGINIHSLLIIRNGKMMLDAYFYPYDGSTIHDLASVTKSITPSLLAIAAEQGKLALDSPLLSFFPERSIANRDERKARLTLLHLASMSNGMESVCKENNEGTLQEMMASPDFVQFALDRKMTYEPGTHFCYDSPGMHLLSAALQEATGMTAYAFIQQNIFAPLNITRSLWESDPQGYNDGWGDLYLHPHDMAKIGYLWLNRGEWDGKQVVPRQWAEASVTPQMDDTGEGNAYGYGWWLDRGKLDVYSANGRGGQHIKVVPEWNLIVVTTGGGFDFDEISERLLAALVDMEKPLPANPEGVAQLEAAVAAVAQPPAPQRVAPLPATAREISGRTILLPPNSTGVESISIEFDLATESAGEAVMRYKLFGSDQTLTVQVGLDGIYRLSSGDHDLPQGYRGYWMDAQTFLLEYDNIANNDHVFYQVRFDGERVFLEVRETSHEGTLPIEGELLP